MRSRKKIIVRSPACYCPPYTRPYPQFQRTVDFRAYGTLITLPFPADGAALAHPQAGNAILTASVVPLTVRFLTEYLVHHLCTLGKRGPDLVPVDRLSRGRTVVPGQQGDALHGDAIRG
jgi:hypothetical protein